MLYTPAAKFTHIRGSYHVGRPMDPQKFSVYPGPPPHILYRGTPNVANFVKVTVVRGPPVRDEYPLRGKF